MRKLCMLAAAAALMGLGAASPALADSSPSFDLNGLVSATHADLAAAKADADAHGDQFASQCYAGVDTYITAHPVSLPGSNVVGVASAFQAGRDVVKGAEAVAGQGAIPSELVSACGPLALDVQNDLGKAAAGGISIFGLKL